MRSELMIATFFLLASEFGYEEEFLGLIKGRLDLEDELYLTASCCVPYVIVIVG